MRSKTIFLFLQENLRIFFLIQKYAFLVRIQHVDLERLVTYGCEPKENNYEYNFSVKKTSVKPHSNEFPWNFSVSHLVSPLYTNEELSPFSPNLLDISVAVRIFRASVCVYPV